jgi:hypothetical protein
MRVLVLRTICCLLSIMTLTFATQGMAVPLRPAWMSGQTPQGPTPQQSGDLRLSPQAGGGGAPTAVPVPGTVALIGLGLALVVARRRT